MKNSCVYFATYKSKTKESHAVEYIPHEGSLSYFYDWIMRRKHELEKENNCKFNIESINRIKK